MPGSTIERIIAERQDEILDLKKYQRRKRIQEINTKVLCFGRTLFPFLLSALSVFYLGRYSLDHLSESQSRTTSLIQSLEEGYTEGARRLLNDFSSGKEELYTLQNVVDNKLNVVQSQLLLGRKLSYMNLDFPGALQAESLEDRVYLRSEDRLMVICPGSKMEIPFRMKNLFVHQNQMYGVDEKGRIFSLEVNPEGAKIDLLFDAGSPVGKVTPAFDHLFFVNEKGTLYGLKDGEERFKFNLGIEGREDAKVEVTSLYDGTVSGYVFNENQMYEFSLSSNSNALIYLAERSSPPVFSEDKIYSLVGSILYEAGSVNQGIPFPTPNDDNFNEIGENPNSPTLASYSGGEVVTYNKEEGVILRSDNNWGFGFCPGGCSKAPSPIPIGDYLFFRGDESDDLAIFKGKKQVGNLDLTGVILLLKKVNVGSEKYLAVGTRDSLYLLGENWFNR